MSRLFTQVLPLSVALAFSTPGLSQDKNEYYEQGVQAYAEQEYAEAYIHLKNALQVDPNMVSARLLLAKVHFNAGDVHGAAKESEEALLLGADINLVLPIYGTALVLQKRVDKLFELEKAYPEFTPESRFEWALLKGQGYLLQGETDRARREFEEAAAMFPADVRSNNNLAAGYIRSGMLEEAGELIARSRVLDPDNTKTLELEAELAIAEDHYDAALRSLETAHALDSKDIRVLRALARVHLMRGEEQELERYLELILEESPQDPAATLLSAIVMISQGDMETGNDMLSELSQTLSELDTIMMQSSDNMLFIQAASDYVRGSDQSAVTLFNTYLSRNPSDLAAIRMLTDLYLRNGESRRANDLLSSKRQIILADRSLSLQLLRLYIDNGSVLSARELLDELRESTDSPYIAVLEAELNRSVGQAREALGVLSQAEFAGEPPLSYWLLRGALLHDLGREEEAQDIAAKVVRAYPDAVRAHNFAAVTYLRAGDLERAAAAADSALALSRFDVEARFNRAMVLKQRGELAQSATLLNEILVDRPSHINSIMLMARILYLQGQQEAAMDWSKKVYAYDKESPLPDEFRLDVYTREGNWDDALTACLALSKADPLNTDYLVQQAEIYLQLQDFEVAQRPLRRLASLWEGDADSLVGLAEMQVRARNLPEARLTLGAALDANPASLDARLALVRLDIAEGKLEQAEEGLSALEGKIGQHAELSRLRGDLAMAQDDPQEAQANYLQAYRLDRRNDAAVMALYRLSLQGVGGEEFTAELESSMRETALSPALVRMLADSYMVQGESGKAIVYYELLLEHPQLQPDPGVLNNLANLYAADDLDKGLATAMRALELTKRQNPALLDTVGWILTRKGQHEEALPYLRQAYALNSRDAEIRYHTGVTLLALGREKEAQTELRAALGQPGEFPGRQDAERLLASLQP